MLNKKENYFSKLKQLWIHSKEWWILRDYGILPSNCEDYFEIILKYKLQKCHLWNLIMKLVKPIFIGKIVSAMFLHPANAV